MNIRLRPASFASYIARSAADSRSEKPRPCCPSTATPAENVKPPSVRLATRRAGRAAAPRGSTAPSPRRARRHRGARCRTPRRRSGTRYRRPQRHRQHATDFAQHDVARRMAVAIVDLLEVIEIDQCKGERRAAPLGCAKQPRHHRVEIATVEELRQRIVDGLDGELCLQRLDLDHLVLKVGVEPFELRVQPLGLFALQKRAVALGACVPEFVLDTQHVVLGARAMRQSLGLRGEQLARIS